MNTGFDSHLDRVRDVFQRLLRVTPVVADKEPSPIPKGGGIYVFYKNGQPLRVGRTGNLRDRVKAHYKGDHAEAAFAVALAREETKIRATYKKETSAAYLVKNHLEFSDAFDRAKERISKMHVQCVSEPDPDCRFLLEFYAAKELRTPYNSFGET